MTIANAKTTASHSGKTPAKPGEEQFELHLYVAGMTPLSMRAITNINEICEQYLQGRYTLRVIDLYQQPTLAVREQIIALPTLIKKLPLPKRRIVGDLSMRDQVLIGLDLKPKT